MAAGRGGREAVEQTSCFSPPFPIGRNGIRRALSPPLRISSDLPGRRASKRAWRERNVFCIGMPQKGGKGTLCYGERRGGGKGLSSLPFLLASAFLLLPFLSITIVLFSSPRPLHPFSPPFSHRSIYLAHYTPPSPTLHTYTYQHQRRYPLHRDATRKMPQREIEPNNK